MSSQRDPPTDRHRVLRTQAVWGRGPRSRCTHTHIHSQEHTGLVGTGHLSLLMIFFPRLLKSPAALPSITSKRLPCFGAMGLRVTTRTSAPIAGYLIAPPPV